MAVFNAFKPADMSELDELNALSGVNVPGVFPAGATAGSLVFATPSNTFLFTGAFIIHPQNPLLVLNGVVSSLLVAESGVAQYQITGLGVAAPQIKNDLKSISTILKGNDLVNGTTADDDKLIGFTGDDVIIGKAGDDRLFGSAGADRLVGGPGKDTMTGGAASTSSSSTRRSTRPPTSMSSRISPSTSTRSCSTTTSSWGLER